MPTDLSQAILTAGAPGTDAAGTAGALVEYVIDPVLLEYVRRYSPLVRAIPTQRWTSTVYYFNRRTALPSAGPVLDGGARPVTSSTYTQTGYTIRNFQVVGAVTGYAQEVTRELIGNLRATEIEGAVRDMSWAIETDILWGNATATGAGPYPHFDGLDTICNVFSGETQNCINAGGNAIGGSGFAGYLDQLIDMVESNVAMPVETGQWMFVVSPTANSRLAQIMMQQQRYFNEVEAASGMVVPAYRNIPLIKSSFLAARSYGQSTVTTTVGGTGGTLAVGTYNYRVAPVIGAYGEVDASASVAADVAAAGDTVTLSFSPITGPDGNVAVLYKVYRTALAGAAGTETLLGYVDAFVQSGQANSQALAVNQIVDNGTNLIPQNNTGGTITDNTWNSASPAAYVGTNVDLQPMTPGNENIYLIPRNRNFLVRPEVRPLGTVIDVYPTTAQPDALPFAMMTDTVLAVRAPKYLGRLTNVNVALAG